jgi:methionyl aminopeptidase
MIYYKTAGEIEKMRQAALVVSRTLAEIARYIGPGISTLELDKIAENYILKQGAVPGFKGYNGYPATLCTSVNEQVVHGIPNNRKLQDGDVVSVDCGAILNGFHGDHAYTFMIGEVKPEIKKLLQITKESLYIGINMAKAGNRIGDIGYAIQTYTEKHGYGVVRELTGHGLGRSLHEDPSVPNYGRQGKGKMIQDGLVIAIEPMINLGKKEVRQLEDGWTIVTRDALPSAHYEHDIAVVDKNPVILSTFDYLEEVLRGRGLEVL